MLNRGCPLTKAPFLRKGEAENTLDNLDLDVHGKTWAEALAEFVDAYNRAVQPGGHTCRTLTVIHGYGSTGSGGVLRTRFRKFFENHRERLEFTPGERVGTNPGYTLVTPKHPLPDGDAALCELVWDYCQQPKTLSKIVGQFRRYGNPRVQGAIRSLETQRRLLKMAKGKNSAYRAV